VTALALLCAAAAASPGARGAAAFVPARVDGALLLDGARGADGLRAFFDAVAQRAPALAAGPRIAALVGPDLIDEPDSWGLAPSGPRAVVLASGSAGLTAPVRDARAARSALQSWLAEAGAVHPVRSGARGALAAGEGKRLRTGLVLRAGGGFRLLTASGGDAAALLGLLARTGGRAASLSADRTLAAAVARLTGPAALVARGEGAVLGTALSLEGSAQGLLARGLVLARAPLLAGAAPGSGACAGASLTCVRASLAPAGREVLSNAARAYLVLLLAPAARAGAERLAQRACATAQRLVVRSDGADTRLLSNDRSAAWALRLQAVTAPSPGEGSVDADGPRSLCLRADAASAWFGTPCPPSAPADASAPGGTAALEAQLDLRAMDAVLQKLSPLDALQGGLAAGIYAGRLTLGGLLRSSGPITVTGQPHASGAEVELRWPLQ
jgi:hypothetical protein